MEVHQLSAPARQPLPCTSPPTGLCTGLPLGRLSSTQPTTFPQSPTRALYHPAGPGLCCVPVSLLRAVQPGAWRLPGQTRQRKVTYNFRPEVWTKGAWGHMASRSHWLANTWSHRPRPAPEPHPKPGMTTSLPSPRRPARYCCRGEHGARKYSGVTSTHASMRACATARGSAKSSHTVHGAIINTSTGPKVA